MIKLTRIHYKIANQALEIQHNINEHNEEKMYNWEDAVESAKLANLPYPSKPFLEPLEFNTDDYKKTEAPYRCRQ